jgi:hypothetical protein
MVHVPGAGLLGSGHCVIRAPFARAIAREHGVPQAEYRAHWRELAAASHGRDAADLRSAVVHTESGKFCVDLLHNIL